MRALFTTWEGGGHVPPALVVARRMQERGAEVLFVSDEATRPAAAAHGLAFAPWTTAPNRLEGGRSSDTLDDWKSRTPWGVVRAVCDAVMCRPAGQYAADTLALIDAFRPDVVVSNELLLGVLAAAESRGVPAALLTGNLWCYPTREDLPPFGPAFPPARTEFERRREDIGRRMIARLYDQGLGDLNRAREGLGLKPLASTLEALGTARLTVLGVSRAFDYDARPPEGVIYAGPLAVEPAWASVARQGDAGAADGRPLVLVSFSTTFQDEARIGARCIEALGRLPVAGIVTLGPALEGARLPARPNVQVLARASHDEIVPRCSAVICHGGHGTLIRPIMHGVPVISIPTGRDQPENARRVSVRGAGLTLSRRASAGAIAAALRRVLTEPAFAAAAAKLGAKVRAEADGGLRAAEAIESVGRRSV